MMRSKKIERYNEVFRVKFETIVPKRFIKHPSYLSMCPEKEGRSDPAR